MSDQNERRPRELEAATSFAGDTQIVKDLFANSETSRVAWEFGEDGAVMTVETVDQRMRFHFIDGGDA